jgi:osmotically-inducible protein OsmY
LTALLATLLGAASHCLAHGAPEKANTRLEEVVVNSARIADEQVTQRVEKKLANDSWIFSEHITVTTRNGVVHLEGIVGDTGEWFRILDLCRKIPGARRVVSELEIIHNDPDGG